MKKLIIYILLFLPKPLSAQCTGNEPIINLGNDTSLCFGQGLTLSAPLGYDAYVWSNGATGSSINITQPGNYSVTGTNFGVNLVQFGDFEGGTTAISNNFTTSYIPGTGGTWGLLSNEGQYAIATSPSLTHNNFVLCGDHTSGTGNMLVVNGSVNANTSVWSQAVTVVPNTNYSFSFWVTNVINSATVAQLQLYINNVPISAVIPTGAIGCQWLNIAGVWNSGAATTATLSIINQATSPSGNDFAIDDISFNSICTQTDNIQVGVQFVTAYGGQDVTICPGDSVLLTATTNVPQNTLIWEANGVPGSTIYASSPGAYVVSAVSPGGCTFNDTVQVNFTNLNWEIGTLVSNPAGCGQQNGSVFADIDTLDPTGPPLPSFVYTWNGPGANNPNSVNTFGFNNLSPGWYYLDVMGNGCHLKDSVEVLGTDSPISVLSANPTVGFGPLDVTIQNTSQFSSNFLWIVDSIGNQSTTQLDSLQLTFVNPGSYQIALVATSGNCTDTSFITILVLPPPVEPEIPVLVPFHIGEVPNVFSPNGDDKNDVFTFEMSGIRSFQIEIVNRWGNIVYSTKDPLNFGWKDTDAADGVYFYSFEATGYQNETLKKQGFLHLVR